MELIAVGRVRTAFGIAGELKVESFSGEIEHLLSLEQVLLKGRDSRKEYGVEAVRQHGKGVLLKLRGIETPEAAKQLAGCELWVPRTNAAPLSDGEFYLADLVGCGLYFQEVRRATVVGVWDNGQCHQLEVAAENGGTYNVPFMSRYVGDVDTDSGRIELLVDWLLE